ncbi:unnamed protein product [Victoria cruziana]
MCLPPGYEKSGRCCKLKKSLYGLKQSPRAWFERLRVVMRDLGYNQGNGDHTLLIKITNNKVNILLIYVDDMVIAGDDEMEIKKLKKRLADEFDLKDLGKLRYFFGVEFVRSKEGLVMCQRKYTIDLLKETRKLGCRPTSTLVEHNYKMSIKDGKTLSKKEKEVYQRLVGKLIYLTLTRPDITYAVNLVSQFMHVPTDIHLQATEGIFCYLKKHPNKRLLFTKSSDMRIEGYSDADWAGSIDTRRSTTGYCIYLGGNLIIWRSKRQTVCARSSADAEYRVVAMKTADLLWLKILLRDIGIRVDEPMKIFCDNKIAINLANNPIMHNKIKYMKIDWHFIRENIDSKELILPYVRSEDQVADVFTKWLSCGVFERNISTLSMFDIYAHLEEEC